MLLVAYGWREVVVDGDDWCTCMVTAFDKLYAIKEEL
jgi:hypothetical protein